MTVKAQTLCLTSFKEATFYLLHPACQFSFISASSYSLSEIKYMRRWCRKTVDQGSRCSHHALGLYLLPVLRAVWTVPRVVLILRGCSGAGLRRCHWICQEHLRKLHEFTDLSNAKLFFFSNSSVNSLLFEWSALGQVWNQDLRGEAEAHRGEQVLALCGI